MWKRIVFLGRMLVWAGVGVGGALWFSRHAGETTPGLTLLAALCCLLVSILVHETGHLAAGVISGMRPVFMVAGPVGLHWKPGHSLPRPFLSGMIRGGLTLCVPRSDEAVGTRMIMLLAGGPAASLVLAAAGGAVAFNTGGDVSFAAGITSLISAVFLLTTAIPSPRKGRANDGAKIRMLLRNGPAGRSLTACLGLTAAARSGTRPAQWSSGLLKTALAAETGSQLRASALHFAFWVALDAGDTDRAGDLLSDLLQETASAPDSLAAPVAYEAAAFYLFVRGDADAARALIEGRKLPVFGDKYLDPLVRAGLALAQGDMEAAARFARAARGALPHALLPSVAALHAGWLERVEADIAGGDISSAHGAVS